MDYQSNNQLLHKAISAGRSSLYEYEVYQLLNATGVLRAPQTQFISTADLDKEFIPPQFDGEKVVLKIVSDTIVHKTEAGGVKIVANNSAAMGAAIESMRREVPAKFSAYLAAHRKEERPEHYQNLEDEALLAAIRADIQGVLLVEYIPVQTQAFGNELLIGLRHTREFGMTLSAGLGGTDTEIFAQGFRKGLAVVSASTHLTTGPEFLDLFRSTLAYQALSGQLRGRSRLLSDAQLEALFTALIDLGNHFSNSHFSENNADAPFVIDELEINPLALSGQNLVPLDGVCRIGQRRPIPAARPIAKLDKLLHPNSIGIMGVSAEKMNFGRIILNNLLASGYPSAQTRIIRPNTAEIDGVPCIENLAKLEQPLDLLIVAVAADAVFKLVDEIIATNCAQCVMLIPGGLGETEASRSQAATMIESIQRAHKSPKGGPVFLGGNCLGVISHPGNYDSWFIPKNKLPSLAKRQRRNSAIISQSGAFMVTRMSRHPWFDPNYLVALGNQNDITHGDMLSYFADHPEVDVIGVYVEGFNEGDGIDFAKAIRRAVQKGKQLVFYKAGQSRAGRDAAMSHTASIAGEYSICESIVQQAGAIVTHSLSSFNDVFYLAGLLHHKQIRGNRLAALSGAGFETVAMADSTELERFSLQMAQPSAHTHERLHEILKSKGLADLMEVHNPFDINPGADDEAHIACTQAFCEDAEVDAVVVGLDPMSPMMRTLATNRADGFDIHSPLSIAEQLPRLVAQQDKPIIGVIDGGELYTPLVEKLKDQEVPIFRSCDRAVQALARYTEGRLRTQKLIAQAQTQTELDGDSNLARRAG